MTDFRFLVPMLCASAISMVPAMVVVADSSALDDWQFKAGVYLYAAGVKGETASGSDLDISFSDLINNLNMAFMGNVEARKSKWSLAADVVYLNVGAGGGGRVPIQSAPGISVKVEADVKLRAWVLGFTGGYRVLQSERANLDVIAGARYLEISSFLNTSSRPGPLARTGELAASATNWDTIVGVKGEVNLRDNWYAPYYLDAGTGDSVSPGRSRAGSATSSTGVTHTVSTVTWTGISSPAPSSTISISADLSWG
jgi:hypothetical protein